MTTEQILTVSCQYIQNMPFFNGIFFSGKRLFDYKTDYLEEGNEDEIIERYMVQMKYYKEALEKVTESRVKEVYLYLFALDKEVLLKV